MDASLTPDEFADRLVALIAEARADGVSDEAMMAALQAAMEAIREGMQ